MDDAEYYLILARRHALGIWSVVLPPKASQRVVFNAWPPPECCGWYTPGVRNNAHSTLCEWFRW